MNNFITLFKDKLYASKNTLLLSSEAIEKCKVHSLDLKKKQEYLESLPEGSVSIICPDCFRRISQ